MNYTAGKQAGKGYFRQTNQNENEKEEIENWKSILNGPNVVIFILTIIFYLAGSNNAVGL